LDYYHQLATGIDCTTSPGKIVCVGRNYVDHAKELNNPIPSQPLLFIKPMTALTSMLEPILIPEKLGACDHEIEMAILIGKPLTRASTAQAKVAIAGVGLALDLTLRDLQQQLKQKGQPWERAKAFDRSCPLSAFVATKDVDLQSLDLSLHCNGKLKQLGNTRDMLFPVMSLLEAISRCFTLLPGDVVLTGTPAGVGPLQSGDQLKACLADLIEVETSVI
jgi:2-keto-4-pentenoate hydratase/2-oxohepta-3-ene-1,7-dioic acid hydratase in catechol pathway